MIGVIGLVIGVDCLVVEIVVVFDLGVVVVIVGELVVSVVLTKLQSASKMHNRLPSQSKDSLPSSQTSPFHVPQLLRQNSGTPGTLGFTHCQ